jgi:methionyl-tRNA synthetase
VYITTPIYYVNDLPHIGHAYTTIAADAVARFWRLQGQPVFLLTGTDEHGINIQRAAEQRGVSPQQHADEFAAAFKALWQRLDIQYDRFIRTTEPEHKAVALDLWRRLQANGDLYRGAYEGAYCPRCEAYYTSDELVDDACPVHRLPCDHLREENWFFVSRAFRIARATGARHGRVQPLARQRGVGCSARD